MSKSPFMITGQQQHSPSPAMSNAIPSSSALPPVVTASPSKKSDLARCKKNKTLIF